ncbi:hypothetical protein A9Q83_05645 [Alphaproteobacteria bacterium 46_93_T64]|nr:hypothetical protein A9Q83_05645 [Alphaproteobacteria bacterium 46_93_T64]
MGLLLEQPNHAYALKHLLEPRVSPSESINDGVLYPLLRKLETDGIIAGQQQVSASNRKRTIYTVTAKGKGWFIDWLESDVHEEDAPAYDFFLGNSLFVKVQFFDRLPFDQRLQKFKAQQERTKKKLKLFSEIRMGMIEREADPFRIALLDLGVSQQKCTLRWLAAQLKSLSSLATNP